MKSQRKMKKYGEKQRERKRRVWCERRSKVQRRNIEKNRAREREDNLVWCNVGLKSAKWFSIFQLSLSSVCQIVIPGRSLRLKSQPIKWHYNKTKQKKNRKTEKLHSQQFISLSTFLCRSSDEESVILLHLTANPFVIIGADFISFSFWHLTLKWTTIFKLVFI